MKYRSYFSGRLLDKELRTLFEEKGKLPDMSHFERSRHRRTVRLLIGFVLFFALLTGVSWTGFFLFGPSGGGGEAAIEFEGPEIVVAGVPVDLKIHYKNLDRDPLAFANVSLRAPEHLFIVSTAPQPNKDRLRWEFGTLNPRYSGEIRMQVIPYGVQEERVELTGVMSYKPSNFNAEFQTSSSHIFTIRAIPLDIALEGPKEASSGQPAKFEVKVRNHTDETLSQLRATLLAPASFLVTPAKENQTAGVLELGTLEPGKETEFSFTGNFLNNAQGPQEFKLQLEVKQKDLLFPVGEIKHTVELASSTIQLDTLINETPDLGWIRLNQPMRLRVTLKNTDKDPLPEGRVNINISGDMIDWGKAQAEDGSVNDNSHTITFPKEGTLTLAQNQTYEFKATLPLKLQPARTASPFIEVSTELNYDSTTTKTPSKKISVASDLTVSGEARYFSGDGKPVGSGPLPPKVGEETTYELRFRLKNTFHDLDRVIVSSKLPDGVRFIAPGEIKSGRLQFDESSREVRFEIPRMPVTTPELTGGFMIGVTPTAQDQGKLIPLMGVIRAEAFDSISQVNFSADSPPVSSILDADPVGNGKGVIQ